MLLPTHLLRPNSQLPFMLHNTEKAFLNSLLPALLPYHDLLLSHQPSHDGHLWAIVNDVMSQVILSINAILPGISILLLKFLGKSTPRLLKRVWKPYFIPQAHFMHTVPHSHSVNNGNSWLSDSGASLHVTNDLKTLSLYDPYDGCDERLISSLPIANTGSFFSLSLRTPLKLLLYLMYYMLLPYHVISCLSQSFARIIINRDLVSRNCQRA